MKVVDPYSLGLTISKISGDEAFCVCPYHEDSNPSASFNFVKGVFHCFACGTNASTRQLVIVTGGYIVNLEHEAIATMSKLGVDDWEYVLSGPIAYDNAYLGSRRVSNELIEKYQIRESPDGVVIPLHDVTGGLVGALERRYAKLPKYFVYGYRPALWPLSTLIEHKRGDPLFVTEGVFGALRAQVYGLQAVATLSCSSLSAALDYLNGRQATVVFDPDYAGMLGAARMIAYGHRAVFPPIEADEARKATWLSIASRPEERTTSRVYDFVDMFDEVQERKKFIGLLKKYIERRKMVVK